MLALLESVEDTIDFFVSGLTYLIHAQSQKAQPDLQLIAQWQAMDSEAFDLQYSLLDASVETASAGNLPPTQPRIAIGGGSLYGRVASVFGIE